jgi:DNA polymerase III delta subunit
MLSKWKIWDFTKSTVATNLESGLHAVSSYDNFLNTLIKGAITKNISLSTLDAPSITTSWIDDNFKSLGLFGNTDSFCINFADKLSTDVKEALLADDLMLEDRHLILIFDKADDFFKKLTSKDNVHGIKIEAPAFWENDKLLDFVAAKEGVQLSFSAKQTILEYVESTIGSYYNIINKLKVNYDSDTITDQMLDLIIDKDRLDSFEMASLFGFKKMASFYKRILDIDPDFETLRSLFYFLQTHMAKISDPRYIEKKSKPSKYDKQILSQSKVWKDGELVLVMDFLRSLELRAKTKSNFLKSDLRSAYYRSL